MTIACSLCWAELPDEEALRLHEAAEEDRLYDLGTYPDGESE